MEYTARDSAMLADAALEFEVMGSAISQLLVT